MLSEVYAYARARARAPYAYMFDRKLLLVRTPRGNDKSEKREGFAARKIRFF